MRLFQFGFLDFFGILAPGVIFLVNIAVLLYALLSMDSEGIRILQTARESNELKSLLQTSGGGIILSLVLIIVSYLFGFILRLTRPDLADKAASFYLKLTSPKKTIIDKYLLMLRLEKEGKLNKYKGEADSTNKEKLSIRKRIKQFKIYLENEYYPPKIKNTEELPHYFWTEEQYPYFKSTKFIYNRDLPNDLTKIIMKDKKYHNKNMYNYWKELLAARDQNIYSLISQAEAHVRFMSGSLWALLIGFITGIILMINNLYLGLIFTLVSFYMLHIILKRFKNQRRREVKLLLDGIIITSKGENISEISRLSEN